MSQNQKLSLIQPLVDHLMQQQAAPEWRRGLVEQGIMSSEEAMALEPQAVAAAFRTMKIMQFLHLHPDQIMDAIEEHKVSWKVELAEEYRHGVVCY
ncbi:MAG: hypothetical protein KYX62_09480 [Pseudomonadota bacterium]|nr:hypothetical protein [Pseudomonadota bacterium]